MRPTSVRRDDDAVTDRHQLGVSDASSLTSTSSSAASITEGTPGTDHGASPVPAPADDAVTSAVPAWSERGADEVAADDAAAETTEVRASNARGADGDDADWLLASPANDGAGPDSPTEKLPSGSGRERTGRRRWLWPAVAAVLVLALVGGAFFARDLIGVLFPADFDGPGTGSVVVEVADGDSTRAIGEKLQERGVVASARAFGNAAEDDPRGRSISPGFYVVREGMSAEAAVGVLLDPASRLGRVEIRGGTQLDDTAGAGSSTVPGVLSLIARATCEPGRSCLSADDLRRAMATTDPAQLGVPDWALADVARADPNRRLEGLLAPGVYDVAPGASAVDALRAVLRTSVTRLEATGLLRDAGTTGMRPYQVLVVGSLAEREGVAQDFGKVARVIDNRLPIPMRLQLDSTINYPLDRQTLLTTPADRDRPGPYNTYVNLGLPPTPIGAVSTEALRAALDPDPGPWVYFVKCQTDGESCFAVTPAEHDANRRLAQQRGVY